MVQARLNHVAILHSHKNKCQELDLNDTAYAFIHRTAVGRNTFNCDLHSINVGPMPWSLLSRYRRVCSVNKRYCRY